MDVKTGVLLASSTSARYETCGFLLASPAAGEYGLRSHHTPSARSGTHRSPPGAEDQVLGRAGSGTAELWTMAPSIDPSPEEIAQSAHPGGAPMEPLPGTRPKRGPDKKPRKKRPPYRDSQTAPGMGQEMLVGQMKSLGVSNTKIAAMLRMSTSGVNAILNRPHVQEFISQTREAIRHVTLAQIQQAQEGVGEWLKEVIQSRDPKSFDAISRGVLALEKTSASASGENRPVGTQIAIVTGESQREQMSGMLKELLGHYETVDIAPPTPKP